MRRHAANPHRKQSENLWDAIRMTRRRAALRPYHEVRGNGGLDLGFPKEIRLMPASDTGIPTQSGARPAPTRAQQETTRATRCEAVAEAPMTASYFQFGEGLKLDSREITAIAAAGW